MKERNTFLGRRIKMRFNPLTGIIIKVIGEEYHDAYLYKVRFWDAGRDQYRESNIHGAMLFMQDGNPEDIQTEDAGFWKMYKDIATEAALIVGDKTYFEEAQRMEFYLKHL